jgi:Sulfotransferase family
LLGRSRADGSPYVQFARALLGWWPHAQALRQRQVSLWPMVAVSLAYAHCSLGNDSLTRPSCWVEKTPTNERHLERLWWEFPQAKVVHVLRHPLAVYASHRLDAQPALTRVRVRRRILRDLACSYRTVKRYGSTHNDRYKVVRYEDLLERPLATLTELSAFLGIEWHESLLQPTVAGRAVLSNSSCEVSAAPGEIAAPQRHELDLPARDHALLAARLRDCAHHVGYELMPAPSFRHTRGRLARTP